MAAVWMRLRSDLRSRRGSLVGLALLAGIAGGLATAAAAGARRTETAYPRMLAASASYDVLVYNYPDPGLAVIDPDLVERLPQVLDTARVNVFYATVGPGVAAVAPADEHLGTHVDRFRIVEGRRADPRDAGEVTVSYAGAYEYGLEVGSTIPTIPSEDTTRPEEKSFIAQLKAEARGAGLPERLTVVGIRAGPGDLPPISTGSSVVVYGTPALHAALARIDFGDSEVDSVAVRLKRGDADIPSFVDDLERLGGDRGYVQPTLRRESTASVGRAIGPLTTALWLLTALLAFVGLLVVGQAIARHVVMSSDEGASLRALGMTPAQQWRVAVLRVAATGVGAAVITVLVAIALSPLAPIGFARVAEPDPGVRIDAVALALSAVAVMIAVPLLAVFPAWRSATASRRGLAAGATTGAVRPSAIPAALARTGASTPLVAGAHLALAPGRGAAAVPVRSTLLGVVIAIAALSAALGIGASFDHLLGTPRLYGQAWDRQTTNFGEGDFTAGAHAIANDPGLAAVSYGDGATLTIERKTVEALALTPLRGDAYPPVVEGRRPGAAGEIALGIRTMRALGVGLGDHVEVSLAGLPGAAARRMRVVGRIVAPAPTSGEIGELAFLDYETNLPALADVEDKGAAVVMLRFARGADTGAVLRRIAPVLIDPDTLRFNAIESIFPRLSAPVDVVNFGRVEDLPLLLGGALGILAAAVLAHMVASSARRRRRDIAVLKALGLGRRSIRRTIGWQASLLVFVSLVIGLPVGIIGGRWAWTALAGSVGVSPAPQVPLIAVLLTVPGAIVLANAIATIPGRAAARVRPALVLRTE